MLKRVKGKNEVKTRVGKIEISSIHKPQFSRQCAFNVKFKFVTDIDAYSHR